MECYVEEEKIRKKRKEYKSEDGLVELDLPERMAEAVMPSV